MQEIKIETGNADALPVQINKSSKKAFLFEKISFFSLLISSFLSPLFFIPSKFVNFDSVKSSLIVFGVIISLIFWCLAKLKEGKFNLIRSYIFIGVLFLMFAYFLSSIFSDNKSISFLGGNLEVGTFGSVLIGFILMFLAVSVVNTKKRIFYFYSAMFISFFIIALFQTIRLFFGTNFLSLSYFTDIASNTIGKWNELGIYFGLIALLSVATLELKTLSRKMTIVLYFSSATSIFLLTVVNFIIVWYAVGISALLFVIYKVSFRRFKSDDRSSFNNTPFLKKIPYLVLIIVIISTIFIIDGRRFRINGTANNHYNLIGGLIANYFKISQIEIRPSFQGTFDIFKSVTKENPVFGSGPNRFAKGWFLYKPKDINNTPFWNVSFDYGVGNIPTFIATTGLSGLVFWIIFLSLFVYLGFKYVFVKTKDEFSRYLIASSFVVGLYLWIMNTVYTTGPVLFFMTFFFSGIFITSLVNEKLLSVKIISRASNLRRKLFFISGIVLIIIFAIAGGYVYCQKFFSSVYFFKALDSANTKGDLISGEKYAIKSLSFSKADYQYRLLSDIYMARLNALVSQKNLSPDTLSEDLKTLFLNAVNNAESALNYDKTNYQNHILLGRIYESVMSLGEVEDKTFYNSALKNYTEALKLNPKNPEIDLMLARLEVLNKNNQKAKDYLADAFRLKSDYTDAAFLLAQIEVLEGNIKNAIRLVETASTIMPNNPVVYFQLGILKYSDKEKDYKGAAEAFEKAVSLNDSYSNARYFLGLSYYNLGKTTDAINQFEIVQSFNLDNKEVALILKNLKEGRAPFANAVPPIDNKPEQRKKLPISEDGTKTIGTVKTKKK